MSAYKQPYLKLFNCITDIVEQFNTISEELMSQYKQLEVTQQLAEDLYIKSKADEKNDIYKKSYLCLFNAATDIMEAMREADCIVQSEYIKLIESQQKSEELYLLNSENQAKKLLLLYKQFKNKAFFLKSIEPEQINIPEKEADI